MRKDDSIRLGTITAHKHNRIFAVALDGGGTIDANVGSRAARIMFRIVPGDRVRVRLPAAGGKLGRILGHPLHDARDDS